MPTPKPAAASGLASPANIAAAAFALALGLLALQQFRASRSFVADAVPTTAKVVELRTQKKGILDGQAETFATVEFLLDETASAAVRTELPTPIARLGLEPESAVGQTVPIRYNPAEPRNIRYGDQTGSQGALVLLALAIGALFVPMILRRSTLARLASGGGGG